MRLRSAWLLLATLLAAAPTSAQTEAPTVAFRRGNEHAARGRWNEALQEFERLARERVRAPSLYWNWAQAATAAGKKGEALWALLCARDLAPSDSGTMREIERLRADLGLDPSEVSLGLAGDLRLISRRFRFDALAVVFLLVSLIASLVKTPKATLSVTGFVIGVLLLVPSVATTWQAPRGVVVQRDAPLVDAPRNDSVALANLREGEVVPLLGKDGDFVKIQDASGARGFAHSSDVRRLGME